MPKQEILPPVRVEPVKASVPTVHVGGPVTSVIDRFVWNSRSKTIQSLTRLNDRETELTESQTKLVEQWRKKEQALFDLHEDRERMVNGLMIRRVERLEAFQQAQHLNHIAQMRRSAEREHYQKEIINAQTLRTVAQTALVDAEQQLAAQRDLGEVTYRIEHKKRHHQLLDLELLEADKRALLNESGSYKSSSEDDDLIDHALARARDELAADNLDTRRIDAVIRARRGSK
jgi:hypothetical protein